MIDSTNRRAGKLLRCLILAACLSYLPNALADGLHILSSQPDQVSGGDVLVAIDLPEDHLGTFILLNGDFIEPTTLTRNGNRLEGMIDGLEPGENFLRVWHFVADPTFFLVMRSGGQETLVNHPITGPMFSGPQQTPFMCTTINQFGIEPKVDRSSPPGFRVLGDEGEVIGYSVNCAIDPIVSYQYRTTGGSWAMWPEDGETPDNLAMTTTLDGEEVEFVIRVEQGTINRFIYSYSMLIDPASIGNESSGNWDTSRWNGRLLYSFGGGVGIGHSQGTLGISRSQDADALGLGHAVVYSTGTRTSVHYNLQVGGETALMTKEHFIKRYGVPLYTVGLGASGGGIQQYVYAQNHPGLLDAAIPQLSYPDMVTQTIHISDCELMEHFMDVTDRLNSRWQVTENRSLLVGLNATDLLGNPFEQAQWAFGFAAAPGMTECITGWRGLSPLALNPLFGNAPNMNRWEPQSDLAAIEWTHMDDLRHIYGIGDDGFARRAVDNVGVQYGLRAFVDGEITTEEFLRVNAEAGGWKPSGEIVQEGFPFLGQPTPDNFDPWSRRNMMLSDNGTPAPRHQGNVEAISALYESGMIFRGLIDIPTLDIREYLENVLDMHNTHQSFAARQRILDYMGDADHHLVWFAGAGEGPPPPLQFNFTVLALTVMDEWMMNIFADPDLPIADSRPEMAADACFDPMGDIVGMGDDAWAGILDDQPAGACTEAFPIYTTTRIEAGAPITGDVFKCQLKSVETALADGTYGDHTFTEDQIARLHEIFPDGVCDYSLPDAGRPAGL